MSGGSAPEGPTSSQLERELAYYRRECNDLGARLLRLQEEQAQAFREARRSRTVAKLIRECHRLADTVRTPDELGGPVLEVIVENAMCDRAAFVREDPTRTGCLTVVQAVGLGEPLPPPVLVDSVPTFFFTTAKARLEPPAAELTGLLQLPFILWAYDRAAGLALIIGNRVEANVSRAFEAGDRELVEGGLSVYLDILARKRAELQLREAKASAEQAQREAEEARLVAERAARVKSEFLTAMSHEIRTPMTAVIGMADLLAAEPLSAEQSSCVQAIRTSGQHLLAIVNDILDFSRIEAGRLELEEADLSVTALLEEVRTILAPKPAEGRVALTLAIDPALPAAFRGDPTRLKQILLNLVGNALKFTAEGSVAVTARPSSAPAGRVGVRFEVADTGVGIAAEHLPLLFEPFTQPDSGLALRHGGTGLGLAICKRLVQAMGGRIGVESSPGVGSRFWFEVPLRPVERIAANQSVAAAPADLPPLRVLVAEDAATNRVLLGAMLRRRGHSVAFAEDGAQALRLAQSDRFDIVLMDLRMPVMDGIEAARRIRSLPAPAGAIPIVGLTANILQQDRHACESAGMACILPKPINWPDLFAAMADVTARQPGC